MDLEEYLLNKIGLPQSTANIIDRQFDILELPKGHHLMYEDTNSNKIYYIEKGLLRVYYEKDGKDITHDFFAEQSIFTPIEKVFLNQEFPYRVELLEKSVIRTVEYSKIGSYLTENAKLQQFVHYLMTLMIKKLADRLYSIQFQSAQERYKILLQNYPDILLRAPLGNIASYLGITQSTLSVIRGELGK